MEPTLRGQRLKLRPLRAADLPVFEAWYSDWDVRYWLHMSEAPRVTSDVVRGRFGLSKTGRKIDRTRLNWVLDVSGRGAIGEIGLAGVDGLHRRAELRISVGEKACWGEGYATEAMELLLAHAFGVLGLQRVWLVTDGDNRRAQAAFTKCGFRPEGVLRGHRLREGRAIDMIVMGRLQAE